MELLLLLLRLLVLLLRVERGLFRFRRVVSYHNIGVLIFILVVEIIVGEAMMDLSSEVILVILVVVGSSIVELFVSHKHRIRLHLTLDHILFFRLDLASITW